MKTSPQTCECGHEKRWHLQFNGSEWKLHNCCFDDCPCKKFKVVVIK